MSAILRRSWERAASRIPLPPSCEGRVAGSAMLGRSGALSEKARSRAGVVAHLWRGERGEKWRKRKAKAASASGAGQCQRFVTLRDPAHEQAGSLSTFHLTLNKLHLCFNTFRDIYEEKEVSFPATCHPHTHVCLIPVIAAKLQSFNWHPSSGLELCHRFQQDQDLGPRDICWGRRFLAYFAA